MFGKITGIYAIRNVHTGDRYVGQAVDIMRRWKDHQRALAQGQESSPRLQQAWDEFGKDAFVFEILRKCPLRDLEECEQMYLRESCAYNHIGPMTIELRVLTSDTPIADTPGTTPALTGSVSDPRIADMLRKIRAVYDTMSPEQQAAYLTQLDAEDEEDEEDEATEDDVLDLLMDLTNALRKISKGEVPSAEDLQRVQRALVQAQVTPGVAAAQVLPAIAAASAYVDAQQFEQAEALLLQACDFQEANATRSECQLNCNSYEALAKLYRKLKRHDDEIRVLERFSKQPHAQGVGPTRLLERLEKARLR